MSHAVIGIIVMGLALLNPIMALFRPNPNAERRPIFNWMHYSVGSIARILSIANLFLGETRTVNIDKAACHALISVYIGYALPSRVFSQISSRVIVLISFDFRFRPCITYFILYLVQLITGRPGHDDSSAII